MLDVHALLHDMKPEHIAGIHDFVIDDGAAIIDVLMGLDANRMGHNLAPIRPIQRFFHRNLGIGFAGYPAQRFDADQFSLKREPRNDALNP